MGNCCSDKTSSNHHQSGNLSDLVRVYTITTPKDDKAMAELTIFCNSLVSLSVQHVKPLHSFIFNNAKLTLTSTKSPKCTDLHEYLMNQQKGNALPFSTAVQIFKQITEGLQNLHTSSLIHGDLSLRTVELHPENPLTSIQIISLTIPTKQFGGLTQTFSSTSEDSSQFTAPDQAKPSTESDLYSLGIIGKKLFDSQKEQTSLTEKANQLIKQLTKSNAKDRIPLADVLLQISTILDLPTRPTSSEGPSLVEKGSETLVLRNEPKARSVAQITTSAKSETQEAPKKPVHPSAEQAVVNDVPHNNSENIQIISNPKIPTATAPQSQQQQEVKVISPETNMIQNKFEADQTEQKEKPGQINYDLRYNAPSNNNTGNLKRISTQSNHLNQITGLGGFVNAKKEFIAITCSYDANISAYKLSSDTAQLSLLTTFASPNGLRFINITSDQKYVLTADLSSNIFVFDITQLPTQITLKTTLKDIFEHGNITSFQIQQQDKSILLLIGGTYGQLVLCKLSSDFKIESKIELTKISKSFVENVSVARFLNSNSVIFSNDSGEVFKFDSLNQTQGKPFKLSDEPFGKIGRVSAIVVSASAKTIVLAGESDSSIHVLSGDFKVLQSIEHHGDRISHIELSDDELVMTSSSWDGRVAVFTRPDLKATFTLVHNNAIGTSVAAAAIYIPRQKALVAVGGRTICSFV